MRRARGRNPYWLSMRMLLYARTLLYTVVNGPGCFAQNRQWPMVGMFVVLPAMTLDVLGLWA